MIAVIVVLALVVLALLSAMLLTRADLAAERAEADLWRSRALDASREIEGLFAGETSPPPDEATAGGPSGARGAL